MEWQTGRPPHRGNYWCYLGNEGFDTRSHYALPRVIDLWWNGRCWNYDQPDDGESEEGSDVLSNEVTHWQPIYKPTPPPYFVLHSEHEFYFHFWWDTKFGTKPGELPGLWRVEIGMAEDQDKDFYSVAGRSLWPMFLQAVAWHAMRLIKNSRQVHSFWEEMYNDAFGGDRREAEEVRGGQALPPSDKPKES